MGPQGARLSKLFSSLAAKMEAGDLPTVGVTPEEDTAIKKFLTDNSYDTGVRREITTSINRFTGKEQADRSYVIGKLSADVYRNLALPFDITSEEVYDYINSKITGEPPKIPADRRARISEALDEFLTGPVGVIPGPQAVPMLMAFIVKLILEERWDDLAMFLLLALLIGAGAKGAGALINRKAGSAVSASASEAGTAAAKEARAAKAAVPPPSSSGVLPPPPPPPPPPLAPTAASATDILSLSAAQRDAMIERLLRIRFALFEAGLMNEKVARTFSEVERTITAGESMDSFNIGISPDVRSMIDDLSRAIPEVYTPDISPTGTPRWIPPPPPGFAIEPWYERALASERGTAPTSEARVALELKLKEVKKQLTLAAATNDHARVSKEIFESLAQTLSFDLADISAGSIDNLVEIVGSEGFNSWAARHLEKAKTASSAEPTEFLYYVSQGFKNKTLLVESFVPALKSSLTSAMRRLIAGFGIKYTSPAKASSLNYSYKIHFGLEPTKYGSFGGFAERGAKHVTLNFAPIIQDLAAGGSPVRAVEKLRETFLHEALHLLDLQLGEELAGAILGEGAAAAKSSSRTGFVSFTSLVEKETNSLRARILESLRSDLGAEMQPSLRGWYESSLGPYFNAEETFVRMMKIRRSAGTLKETSLTSSAEAKLDAYFNSGSIDGDEIGLRELWKLRDKDKTGAIRELFELFF